MPDYQKGRIAQAPSSSPELVWQDGINALKKTINEDGMQHINQKIAGGRDANRTRRKKATYEAWLKIINKSHDALTPNDLQALRSQIAKDRKKFWVGKQYKKVCRTMLRELDNLLDNQELVQSMANKPQAPIA